MQVRQTGEGVENDLKKKEEEEAEEEKKKIDVDQVVR